jgi:PmbA protein
MTSQISAGHLMEEVSGQVGGAELYQVRSLGMPVSFQAGALESVKIVEVTGRALRVIKEGRLGFSTTTDLTEETTLIRNALQASRYGDPVPFEFPAAQPGPEVRCFDPQVEQLDEETLIALGEEVVDRIKAYDPELEVHASLRKAIDEVTLLNTSGLGVEDRRTSFSLSIGVIRTRKDDILTIHDGASSHRRQDVDALAVADGRIERLRWSETTAAVGSGAMPVVFRSQAINCLLLPLGVGLSGRNVYLGASPLTGKLGQQIVDRRFTLVDDGRLDFASLSAPYDDEGTPTARKTLIQNGVAKQFLYDLKTAAQAGVQPTGNGFKVEGRHDRGYHLPPAVAPTTVLVPPGDQSLEEILVGLDEALLVEQVIGLGQGNIQAGEFSTNVSLGFLVRKGEIVGRVKNTMIAGNVYDLLRDQLIALSDRAEWYNGILHAPAIAVDGVGVASQG